MLNLTTSPRLRQALCIGTGLLFMATGALKFFMPAPGPGFHGGARGFGEALALLGVPLATVFGYVVPLMELVGGLGLVMRRAVRLWAALLAVDMVMAIGLVGIPGALGRPLNVGHYSIGAEAWRLPLEIALLLAMLWLSISPGKGQKIKGKSYRQH